MLTTPQITYCTSDILMHIKSLLLMMHYQKYMYSCKGPIHFKQYTQPFIRRYGVSGTNSTYVCKAVSQTQFAMVIPLQGCVDLTGQNYVHETNVRTLVSAKVYID